MQIMLPVLQINAMLSVSLFLTAERTYRFNFEFHSIVLLPC